jgi:hypothetical protein
MIRQKPTAHEIVDRFLDQSAPWDDVAEGAKTPLAFQLAQRLKWLDMGADGQDYEEAVRHYCVRAETDFEDFYTAFLTAFDNAKFGKSDIDTFTEAARLADESPVEFPEGFKPPTENYRRIYSLCVHLDRHNHGEPFILPQTRIATWLGIPQPRVSNILAWLGHDKRQIIRCVDRTCRWGPGVESKAMRYELPGSEQPVY